MSDPSQNDQRLAAVTAFAATVLVGLYSAAQLALLGRFAKLIAKYGVGDLLHIQLRKASKDTVAQVAARVPDLVTQVVKQAVTEAVGNDSQPPTLRPFGLAGDTFESHAERSARAIREDLEGKLNQLAYPITRFADDAYRAIVADSATVQVLGETPFQAQGTAYRDLTRRGIDGFTDSKGRKWELSAYVEMAVRTAAQRAFNVSHLDRMQSLGIDLFIVPGDGHPCPLCLPWENKILSVQPDSRADGTIAEATAAGLFHPRCRHVLAGFLPGVTVIPPAHEWTAEDQHRYDDTQQQRAIERSIRAAERQLEGAYTPEMRTAGSQNVRAAQKAMRDFLARTGFVRRPNREQLNLGL